MDQKVVEVSSPAAAPRLAVGAAWSIDEGLGELTYKAGSWVCGLCGTVRVGGPQCTGTYDRNCRRLASARPTQTALPAAEKRKAKRDAGVTKIEQILKEKSWDCDHCGKGNLSFRFKCYKCSYPRPSQEDSSEEEVRQESEVRGRDQGQRRVSGSEKGAQTQASWEAPQEQGP